MPTYNEFTLDGFYFKNNDPDQNPEDDDAEFTDFGLSKLRILASPDYKFGYDIIDDDDPFFPIVEVSTTDGQLHGLWIGEDQFLDFVAILIYELAWGNGKVSTVIEFRGPGEDHEDHVFVLAGDAFPDITNLDELKAFSDAVNTAGPVEDGPLAPGSSVGLGELDFGSIKSVNKLVGTNSADNISGGSEDDEIHGLNGADEISSGAGDDRVYSGSGADVVELGSGNDYVKVGGGQEYFDGGSGKDYISYYDSTNGITANLEEDTVSGSWAVNDTIKNFESIAGSKNGGDTIYGTSGSNTIRTYGGNDKVYAGAGSDKVELGDGNDYVQAGGGVESFDGGAGKDYISYYKSSNGVTLNFENDTASGSWASNDIVKNFESASGSKTGDDDFTGTSGSNTFKTYGGDDRVAAGGGTDRVELGSGNDYVRVGGGKEYFDGGSGKDYISYYDSSNGIRIDLRDDEVSGSWAVNDTIKDFESASGSKTGHDVMLGTNGSNTLKGFGGDDKLYGRGGNDKMYGGDGTDYFDGGDGMDLLYGGDDADVFHFDKGEGDDVIKDFENNVDTVEFDNFGMTKAQVYALATNVGDDVVFDFGANGTLTIEDATRGQLLNDFEVV